LTQKEYEEIAEKAQLAGYHQLAPFMKECAFSSQLIKKELEGSQLVSEKMDELIRIVREQMYVKVS
jgi:hypothetical protein